MGESPSKLGGLPIYYRPHVKGYIALIIHKKGKNNLPNSTDSPDLTAAYLSSSLMPTLPAEASALLEVPITLSELQMALKTTKSGKAPDPDGLTVTYYRTLLPSLGDRLVTLFNTLGTGTSLHDSTLLAQIAVIHKDGKDPGQCGSYRPIC